MIRSLGVLTIVQEELARGLAVLDSGSRHDLICFNAEGDWRSRLGVIEERLRKEPSPRKVMIFASIPVCKHIRRSLPHLARGVILQDRELSFHAVAGWLPSHWLLNRSFVILPFGQLASRREQLRTLFGERIFLRPDSSLKPFAGYDFPLAELDFELNSIRSLNSVHDDLLVVVDRARTIGRDEYRIWMAGGEILTHAGYNHRQEAASSCPPAVLQLAAQVARHVETAIDPVVADLVLDEAGMPRVIEMNAVSSSGFYEGMSFDALLGGMDELLA